LVLLLLNFLERSMRLALIVLAWLVFLPSCALADDRVEHGDWYSQFLEGMGEAGTHENGLSTFGILCADGNCRYYFANGINCEPSSNYPLMITTEGGAVSVESVCEPVSTANGEIMVYWFNESDAINQAFQKTMVVGFAFPLSDGKFKVNKFSMDGFKAALDRMVSGLRDKRERQKDQSSPGDSQGRT
jgi:hypothetical protein